MNIGERNELHLKLMLVWMRDTDNVAKTGPFEDIKSVGFGPVEYGQLPDGINPSDISVSSESNIIDLAADLGISKAPGRAKADVFINGDAYSAKSLQSAPPALANHTARPGFEMACDHSGANIEDLDEMINDYWDLRKRGSIREDIKNNDSNSPFRNNKQTMKPVLEYFLFKGTGSGLSSHPADYILDFDSPVKMNTWRVLTPDDAVDMLWPKLVFSLRSKKGMPAGYPDNRDKSKNASIAQWTRYLQGQHRGALHIRATK